MPVAEEDIPKTALVCHSAALELLRMLFGLPNAPAIIKLAIDIILSEVTLRHCPVCLDDVIVSSRNIDDHVKHVDEVLTLLRNAGVTRRLESCDFFRQTVEFLGHQITRGTLRILEANTRAFPRCMISSHSNTAQNHFGNVCRLPTARQGLRSYSPTVNGSDEQRLGKGTTIFLAQRARGIRAAQAISASPTRPCVAA